MSEQPAGPRLIAGSITITKLLDETAEGGVVIEVDYSEDLPLVDAMGMLAFVAHNVQGDYEIVAGGDGS